MGKGAREMISEWLERREAVKDTRAGDGATRGPCPPGGRGARRCVALCLLLALGCGAQASPRVEPANAVSPPPPAASQPAAPRETASSDGRPSGAPAVAFLAMPAATAPEPGASAEQTRVLLETFAAENDGKTLRVEVFEPDPEEGLRVSCPVGVLCNRDFSYRAYSFRGDGLRLRFSFDASVVGDLRLASLRDNFEYANYSLAFESLSTRDWVVVDGTFDRVIRADSQRIEWLAFQDGRLQANIMGTIGKLRARSSSKDCRRVADGATPQVCDLTVEANIPFVIQLDVALEPTGVLDCRDREVRDRCG